VESMTYKKLLTHLLSIRNRITSFTNILIN